MPFRQRIKGLAFLNIRSLAQSAFPLVLLPCIHSIVGVLLRLHSQPANILFYDLKTQSSEDSLTWAWVTSKITNCEANASCLHRLWGLSSIGSCLLKNSKTCISQTTLRSERRACLQILHGTYGTSQVSSVGHTPWSMRPGPDIWLNGWISMK